MNLTIFQEGASPFDQIRQVDEFGTEYWLARQLQPLLGYSRWQRFEETIERAKLNTVRLSSKQYCIQRN
jgi:hypothetical protein